MGVAVAGMDDMEVRDKCFHDVSSQADVERVLSLVGSAQRTERIESRKPVKDTSVALSTENSDVLPSKNTRREKNDRKRKSIEDRVAKILEGLPAQLAGENLL